MQGEARKQHVKLRAFFEKAGKHNKGAGAWMTLPQLMQTVVGNRTEEVNKTGMGAFQGDV